MQEARLRLLQDMPIFGGIQEQTLSFILDNASIVNVNKGQHFFHEGDLASSMYVLELGGVEIFRTWEGVPYKLRELHCGDCFGEMALIECSPRSATVRALQDSRAIEITAAKFAGIYTTHPEQFILIYMNIGRELCRRLREADTRLFIGDLRDRQKVDDRVDHR